jgi:hypothetical protein
MPQHCRESLVAYPAQGNLFWATMFGLLCGGGGVGGSTSTTSTHTRTGTKPGPSSSSSSSSNGINIKRGSVGSAGRGGRVSEGALREGARKGLCSGSGWANTSIPTIPAPGHDRPSSVVHSPRICVFPFWLKSGDVRLFCTRGCPLLVSFTVHTFYDVTTPKAGATIYHGTHAQD